MRRLRLVESQLEASLLTVHEHRELMAEHVRIKGQRPRWRMAWWVFTEQHDKLEAFARSWAFLQATCQHERVWHPHASFGVCVHCAASMSPVWRKHGGTSYAPGD